LRGIDPFCTSVDCIEQSFPCSPLLTTCWMPDESQLAAAPGSGYRIGINEDRNHNSRWHGPGRSLFVTLILRSIVLFWGSECPVGRIGTPSTFLRFNPRRHRFVPIAQIVPSVRIFVPATFALVREVHWNRRLLREEVAFSVCRDF